MESSKGSRKHIAKAPHNTRSKQEPGLSIIDGQFEGQIDSRSLGRSLKVVADDISRGKKAIVKELWDFAAVKSSFPSPESLVYFAGTSLTEVHWVGRTSGGSIRSAGRRCEVLHDSGCESARDASGQITLKSPDVVS